MRLCNSACCVPSIQARLVAQYPRMGRLPERAAFSPDITFEALFPLTQWRMSGMRGPRSGGAVMMRQ